MLAVVAGVDNLRSELVAVGKVDSLDAVGSHNRADSCSVAASVPDTDGLLVEVVAPRCC